MIWCVEDEKSIRDIELYTLKSTGFDARGFENGEELMDALKSETPKLILLDIMLPGEDGNEILAGLRDNPGTAKIPVIMATARGTEYDRIQGLNLGADDYLVKPFSMLEMVARIKAVLRRTENNAASGELVFLGISMNVDRHRVEIDGEGIELTYKEFELLRLFLENPGIAFSREQIFARVWDEGYIGESRTVDMHIRTLRQKLGIYGNAVTTVRNIGYRLEASEHG